MNSNTIYPFIVFNFCVRDYRNHKILKKVIKSTIFNFSIQNRFFVLELNMFVLEYNNFSKIIGY